jgi:hypothetical protein
MEWGERKTMSNTLRGMALAAYGLLISTQFAFGGNINNFCGPGFFFDGIECVPIAIVPGPLSVPEPGTLALLATGIGVLALARFRKRK